MLPNTDYDNVIRKLRQVIITYVGLNNNRVLNALSVRGADLLKIISETELNSFNLSDSFIVFEMVEDPSKEYYVMDEDEDYTCYISYMNMELKLYGKPCHEVSRRLIAMFKDEMVIMELYNSGIYYKGITGPSSVNEFINNTLWPRCDMTIKVQIKTKVAKPISDEFFNVNDGVEEVNSSLILKKV